MELTKLTPTEHPLKRILTQCIERAEFERPRSLQKAIGPSGAGEPCTRKLAYKLLEHDGEGSSSSDPWPAIVGTAVHAWLADALTADNERNGKPLWVIEQTLQIRAQMQGSCDAYYIPTQTVIDHKVPGATKYKEMVRYGPPLVYRRQLHLYGYGYAQLGFPVAEVALAVYPRAGMLSGLHVWSEPYDESIALDTLSRMDTILETVIELDVEHHPERYAQIPRLPGDHCRYCPWMRPTDTDPGTTCPGEWKGRK